MLCLCHYRSALERFWFESDLGREKKNRWGRRFVTMVTRWSHSTSNFYAPIGQNLTGEFRRKIYTASWNLFTLVAEAVSGLCQFVMLWTVFYHWVYKIKYSCCQVSSVIHGWFVYWVFGWKIRRMSKSEIRFRMVYRFLFLPCLMSKSVEKS